MKPLHLADRSQHIVTEDHLLFEHQLHLNLVIAEWQQRRQELLVHLEIVDVIVALRVRTWCGHHQVRGSREYWIVLVVLLNLLAQWRVGGHDFHEFARRRLATDRRTAYHFVAHVLEQGEVTGYREYIAALPHDTQRTRVHVVLAGGAERFEFFETDLVHRLTNKSVTFRLKANIFEPLLAFVFPVTGTATKAKARMTIGMSVCTAIAFDRANRCERNGTVGRNSSLVNGRTCASGMLASDRYTACQLSDKRQIVCTRDYISICNNTYFFIKHSDAAMCVCALLNAGTQHIGHQFS